MFIPNELEILDNGKISNVKLENDQRINKTISAIIEKVGDVMANSHLCDKDIHTKLFMIIAKEIKKYTSSKIVQIFLKGGSLLVSTQKDSQVYDLCFGETKCVISNHFSESQFKDLKQCLYVPVLNKGSKIGKVIFINRKKKYKKQHVNDLRIIFNIISKIIVNYSKWDISDIQEQEILKLKNNFLSTMSHEIRTPLSGIVGMISLLEDSGNLNDKQKSYIERTLICCDQLMDIIMDILDYSKMKGGHLILNESLFDVKGCVSNVIEVVTSKKNTNHLDINIDIDETIPKNLYGDQKRLKQILINLVTNSIKFTSKGFITVKATTLKSNDFDTLIRFEVIDSGIGIEEKDFEKIFNMFEQINTEKYNGSTHGTGMGLAISKELLNLMNSDLHVTSKGIDKGSTFWFEIKFQKEVDIKNTPSLNILVVDDNIDNRIIINGFLSNWNFKSTICASSLEALHYLRLGYKYDLAIIDICMPKMDGIELAQQIKKKFPKIPLIALTSKEVGDSGKIWFETVIQKPYNKVNLFNNIIEITNEVKNSTTLRKKNSQRKLEDLKICVAEDDEMNQIVLTEMLKNCGIKEGNVYLCNNGEESVECVKNNKIDICLMDLKMPIMDGFTASQHIKNIPNPPSIVIVSASILDSDKIKCSSIGIDAYITKPYNITDLKNTLNQYK